MYVWIMERGKVHDLSKRSHGNLMLTANSQNDLFARAMKKSMHELICACVTACGCASGCGQDCCMYHFIFTSSHLLFKNKYLHCNITKLSLSVMTCLTWMVGLGLIVLCYIILIFCLAWTEDLHENHMWLYKVWNVKHFYI